MLSAARHDEDPTSASTAADNPALINAITLLVQGWNGTEWIRPNDTSPDYLVLCRTALAASQTATPSDANICVNLMLSTLQPSADTSFMQSRYGAPMFKELFSKLPEPDEDESIRMSNSSLRGIIALWYDDGPRFGAFTGDDDTSQGFRALIDEICATADASHAEHHARWLAMVNQERVPLPEGVPCQFKHSTFGQQLVAALTPGAEASPGEDPSASWSSGDDDPGPVLSVPAGSVVSAGGHGKPGTPVRRAGDESARKPAKHWTAAAAPAPAPSAPPLPPTAAAAASLHTPPPPTAPPLGPRRSAGGPRWSPGMHAPDAAPTPVAKQPQPAPITFRQLAEWAGQKKFPSNPRLRFPLSSHIARALVAGLYRAAGITFVEGPKLEIEGDLKQGTCSVRGLCFRNSTDQSAFQMFLCFKGDKRFKYELMPSRGYIGVILRCAEIKEWSGVTSEELTSVAPKKSCVVM